MAACTFGSPEQPEIVEDSWMELTGVSLNKKTRISEETATNYAQFKSQATSVHAGVFKPTKPFAGQHRVKHRVKITESSTKKKPIVLQVPRPHIPLYTFFAEPDAFDFEGSNIDYCTHHESGPIIERFAEAIISLKSPNTPLCCDVIILIACE